MRIKADENIGRSAVDILRRNNHDVTTVEEQGLLGAPDETIFHACTAEHRVLITLDRDFGRYGVFLRGNLLELWCWNLVVQAQSAAFMRVSTNSLPWRQRARFADNSGSLSRGARVHLEKDDEE